MGKKGRVFLRGMSSEQYGLKEFRESQLAAPRVRNDEIVDNEQAVRLQKVMPHAAVTLVPEVGHMVHYFVADQIVRIADVAQLEAAA